MMSNKLFAGLLIVNLLGKSFFIDSFLSVAFFIIYVKKHVRIDWLSLNSTATKHRMFQVISKNVERETDKTNN